MEFETVGRTDFIKMEVRQPSSPQDAARALDLAAHALDLAALADAERADAEAFRLA
jgi:hypothetical protein